MGYLWVMTIGFVICLGLAGAAFMYGIFSSFKMEDASRIDLIDTKNEDEKT